MPIVAASVHRSGVLGAKSKRVLLLYGQGVHITAKGHAIILSGIEKGADCIPVWMQNLGSS